MEAILRTFEETRWKLRLSEKQIVCVFLMVCMALGLYGMAYTDSRQERIETKQLVSEKQEKQTMSGSLESHMESYGMQTVAVGAASETGLELSSGDKIQLKNPTVEPIVSTPVATHEKDTTIQTIPVKEETIKKTEKLPGVSMPSVEQKVDAKPAVSNISVALYGNGGTPEFVEDSCNVDTFDITKYDSPKRLGKVFDGWCLDPDGTVPFEKVEEGTGNLKLYAAWKELPGFVCDEQGYITGYTDTARFFGDGLAALPTHESCIGIRKGALEGLEDDIIELYIPKNIVYIEPGFFEDLSQLLFIEVTTDNPNYYSEDGFLYSKNGELVARPCGWDNF